MRDDVYGVAQGLNGQYGIRVYRGTCEVKEAEGKEREVLVVAVPATAPHEAACAQVSHEHTRDDDDSVPWDLGGRQGFKMKPASSG